MKGVASISERAKILWSRWKRRAGRSGASGNSRERAGWNQKLIHSLSRSRLPSWRQIRHLPEVLSSNDSVRLQLGALLLVFGVSVLGVRFYFNHTIVAPAVGGSITEGVVGTPHSLNPILAVSNDVDSDLTRLMFSRLYTTDGAGALVPDLAVGAETSADRTTYVVHLKTNARWSDGQPVTADDVLFTLALIQDPNWKSPLYLTFKELAAEKIDNATIRFTLKQPFAPFLSQLTFGILPQHVWKDVQAQSALQSEYTLKPVGSGPFVFDSLKRDRRGFVMSYTVKRNPDYYGKAPYLETIIFQFYPDYETALDALARRDVDSLSYVPRNLRSRLNGMNQVTPVSMALPQYTAVFFNQRKNHALKDKDVRRALAMAVNKSRILLDVLQGEGRPLDAPPLPGYTETLSSSIPYNPDQAASLLDSLGWKLDPQDGIRKKTTATTTGTGRKKRQTQTVAPLKIALTTVNQPETMAVAGIIKNGWSAIGVSVSVNAVEPADVNRTAIQPREYEALLYGQLLGIDPDPYSFWHSSQVADPGLNLALYANRDADAAIEAARKTADPTAREDQYKKFIDILASDLPAAFLYSPTYTYPVPAGLKGFSGTRVANPSDRFATVSDWYLKTKRAWK